MSTMDIITLALAGGSLLVSAWAGLTAHRARTWQLKRYAERRATRVGLEFVHSSGPLRMPFAAWGGGRTMPTPPTVYTVSLEVTNDGEESEFVTAAFLHEAVGDNGLRIYGSEGGIEGGASYELRPRATLQIPTELVGKQVEWMRQGFIAEVWLGSGQRVRSDRTSYRPAPGNYPRAAAARGRVATAGAESLSTSAPDRVAGGTDRYRI